MRGVGKRARQTSDAVTSHRYRQAAAGTVSVILILYPVRERLLTHIGLGSFYLKNLLLYLGRVEPGKFVSSVNYATNVVLVLIEFFSEG